MPTELLARCGYRCDLCLACRENIEKNDMRQALSEGWKRCYGFTIPPDDISCDGCLTENPRQLIDKDCPVRPCVLRRGLDNCSQCPDYPCATFMKRQVVYEEVARGRQLMPDDRELFIRPYENRARLDACRQKQHRHS